MTKSNPIHVHKFGGSSLANSECILNVAEIIKKNNNEPQVVVVSAMKGVTQLLISSCQQAQTKDNIFEESLKSIKNIHTGAISTLKSEQAKRQLTQLVDTGLSEIQDVLKSVWISKSLPETTYEFVCGYGEVWSSHLLNAYLIEQGISSKQLDAREFLYIQKGEIGPFILWEKSQQSLEQINPLKDADVCVATGFVARNEEGLNTTLGLNGSDYSASILAKLFKAQSVTIWTDVDGIYSSDPRYVPDAQLIEHLSYQEAMELAYFGAKVIHPQTMGPLIQNKIKIRIRNTFNTECPGTLISDEKFATDKIVKGFATVDDVTLVNVEGSGMIGVPGVAQRLFGALREVKVSVIMISQASSEHSICFAVPSSQKKATAEAINETFASEIQYGKIQATHFADNCSILAAVGDNMVEAKGVSGRFFSALGRSGVNVRAIAQGSSERNISAVIDSSQTVKALKAVHSAFYLSNFTISIGLIGPGTIGKTFLKQLSDRSENLKKNSNIDFRVRSISNSKKMLLSEHPINLNSWADEFEKSETTMDNEKIGSHICADHIPHSVIIDCTASEHVSKNYVPWLKKGIHIITPNKKASSGPLAEYKELQNTIGSNHSLYFNEATVGAGLPIISTLKDLVETGDKVLKVEGILSGTLSHIFNSFKPGLSFSEIVKDAKEQGYTEPDPRDDLSGMDVARKVVILAREAGFNIDLSQVPIESLISEELSGDLSVDEFMQKLPSMDEKMLELLESAHKNNSVLRYVGSVDKDGRTFVGIQQYPNTHAFAGIKGTDNIIAFTTERYLDQPLIVQGPGAGPAVTAAGVFADLLRLANHLGAQSKWT